MMGPVQLLVIGFDDPVFDGSIMAEVERLRENDVVRLIDVIVVRKTADGDLETIETRDTEAAEEFGATVGALIGVGAAGEEGATIGAVRGAEAAATGELLSDEEVWYLADAIPEGSAAAVALLEHRWAVPLRDAIGRAGGFHLADAWVHPADLVAIGAAVAEEAAAESS
jgi:uncharacterized membrane protein